MSMLMAKNKGFGIVGVVLIIAGLAIAGFVGWRVYESYAKDANSKNSNSQSNTNGSRSTATYLDIKEFGVKIKLSDSIKDATYYYDSEYATKYPTTPYISISTKSLADNSNGTCSASASISPLGMIQRFSSDQDGLGNKLVPNNTTIFKIRGYYYMVRTPQAACSTDKSILDLATSQRKTFFEDFKTIQAE